MIVAVHATSQHRYIISHMSTTTGITYCRGFSLIQNSLLDVMRMRKIRQMRSRLRKTNFEFPFLQPCIVWVMSKGQGTKLSKYLSAAPAQVDTSVLTAQAGPALSTAASPPPCFHNFSASVSSSSSPELNDCWPGRARERQSCNLQLHAMAASCCTHPCRDIGRRDADTDS